MFLASESVEKTQLRRLRDRAQMLASARQFFADRQILEVDCPALTSSASIDAHIDLITISAPEPLYLHSSPEYAMKKLLAQGMGDIYQLSHVFRQGERGCKHRPEFTLAEWYRVGMTFQQMIDETLDFICSFVENSSCCLLTYRQAFIQYAQVDPFQASIEELLATIGDLAPCESSRESLLNIILGTLIEPRLGEGEFTVITHYPAEQAALAQTDWDGDYEVAERFEVYYKGTELANGYHELADPQEQRRRLIDANRQRLHMGKEALPMDEDFIAALSTLPDCCGVAVGFDRLMMLRHDMSDIQSVVHAE